MNDNVRLIYIYLLTKRCVYSTTIADRVDWIKEFPVCSIIRNTIIKLLLK